MIMIMNMNRDSLTDLRMTHGSTSELRTTQLRKIQLWKVLNFEKDSTKNRTQHRTTQLITTQLLKWPNLEYYSASNLNFKIWKFFKYLCICIWKTSLDFHVENYKWFYKNIFFTSVKNTFNVQYASWKLSPLNIKIASSLEGPATYSFICVSELSLCWYWQSFVVLRQKRFDWQVFFC